MATSAQPPPLMTDPLNMAKPDMLIDPVSKQEQDEITRQQEAMERGMPARNLKKISFVVLALIAAGYTLYPKIYPATPAVPPMAVKQTPNLQVNKNESIIEQLKNQPLPKPPEEQGPVEIKKAALPSPPQGLSDGQGDPLLSLKDTEITRKDTITGSSMEPSEFSLPMREVGNSRLQKHTDDPQNALARVLADQNSILEKSLNGATQESERSANGPQIRRSFEDDFVLKTRNAILEDPTRLAPARQKAAIYQGTIIQVVLDRAINTDSPGVARGRVRSDVYDSVNQDILLIPRGSIVILPYLSSIVVGQARILVAGERLIFPNGKSVSLSGTLAADMQGASGLPANVDNHFFEMFKTSFIVGAASLLLPKNQQQISITDTPGGSTKTGGSILATTLYDTIQRISERNATIKPTASIEVGEPFTLMLSKDIELEPYKGRK